MKTLKEKINQIVKANTVKSDDETAENNKIASAPPAPIAPTATLAPPGTN